MNTQQIIVLLVEDESPKMDQITRFLNTLEIPIYINTARSVNSALDHLDAECPNLLILDMSLPTIDVDIRLGETGGRVQGFGGIEVLRYMINADILCPTIVVTGYEAFPREGGDVDLSCLDLELREEFPSLIENLLHYNSTNDTWKSRLKSSIEKIHLELIG